MRRAIGGSLASLAVAVVVVAFWLHVPWETVATAGLLTLCLGWLVLMTTLPWNLHFKARSVLFEMKRSREAGINVRVDREAEAERVRRLTLRASLALHIGSAALAAIATYVTGGHWGYALSGLYLLSGTFRPGVECYKYMRQHLGHLENEVRFPRDDVKTLAAEVRRLGEQGAKMGRAQQEMLKQLKAVQEGAETRDRDLEKRFTTLARTFEDTLDRLTDNQQLISGVKALLRLIQQGGAPGSA